VVVEAPAVVEAYTAAAVAVAEEDTAGGAAGSTAQIVAVGTAGGSGIAVDIQEPEGED
jgi:hypothetical protein